MRESESEEREREVKEGGSKMIHCKWYVSHVSYHSCSSI